MVSTHCAELADCEEFAVFPHALLAKENRSAGEFHGHKNGYDNEYGPQEKQTQERDYSIEEEFEDHEIYLIIVTYFIFL